jgi:hypothetical protein
MFIKLLRGFDFPYLVLCDRDVAVRISCTIKIGDTQYSTSSLFCQLHRLNLLNNDDANLLQEIEGKTAERTQLGRPFKEYNADVFEPIRKAAIRKKFFVLSSTFEGIIVDAGYETLLKESKKHFRKSKVLQGKYVAEKANVVPKEIHQALDFFWNELEKRKPPKC